MTYHEKRRREDRKLTSYTILGTAVFLLLVTATGCASKHPCEEHLDYATPPYDECVEFYDYWTDRGEKVIFRDPLTGEEI